MNLQPFKKAAKAALSLLALWVFAALFTFKVNGQPPQTKRNMIAGTDIYTAVQQQAEFPGGINGFMKYLAQNIKYPADARDKKVQGRVFLSFVIEKDGSLSNEKVLRGIGSGCDEEALRVIKSSPKWKPGRQDGNIVRSQFTVPIMFSLSKG